VISTFKHEIEIIKKNTHSLFNNSMEARDRQINRRKVSFVLRIDQRKTNIVMIVDQRGINIIR
jgi:hypothetical protein